MAESAAQYGLGQAELQRAIKILDQVQQSLPLSRWQHVSYRLFILLISSLAVACIPLTVLWKRANNQLPQAFFIPFFGFSILAFIGALVSIPLNLPLLIKVQRQKMRLGEVGMTDVWIGFLRGQTGRRRWGAIARKSALFLGILLIVAGIATAGTRGKVVLFAFGGAGLVLVMFYFVQEGKVWLDILASRFNEISQLKAA